jgi:kynurenine formamidase
MTTVDQDPEVSAGSYLFKQIGARISNWGRWGDDDELGTLNFITAAERIRAASLIKTGRVFDLAMPFNADGPQRAVKNLQTPRFDPIHMMTATPGDMRLPAGIAFSDDAIFMPLQCGTQWDSLAHAGYDGLLYNGVPMSDVRPTGAERNSIDKVVCGPVGRGVILDIAALKGADCLEPGYPIRPDDLSAAVERQGVEISSGDIVLLRTGWYRHILNEDPVTYMQPQVPGLELSCCEWLHDRQIAALASDTYCVEVKPSGQPVVTHPVHMVLIRDLGMTIGEMFNFEELAEQCGQDGVWETFFVGLPLKFSKAVGSPLMPIAMK